MGSLIEEIRIFLSSNGLSCSEYIQNGATFLQVETSAKGHRRFVLPLEITAVSTEQAMHNAAFFAECIKQFKRQGGEYPLIICRDRWERQKAMMQARLLAHVEIFTPLYARNCEIRRIEKAVAAEFLSECHSYGDASCRYRYGIFLKRHTGHIAAEMNSETSKLHTGDLVAVAEFSNARKWVKGDKVIRSYEWIRYASLPQVRICGGMGKVLQAFVKEVNPDDIMSYADLEWSVGDVYEQLGFTLEGHKAPVLFTIDPHSWQRTPVIPTEAEESLYFQNFGSNKYRLKLTEYSTSD